jgi:hypothetical protein
VRLEGEAPVPIVKCPKCKKRYDPSVDDELQMLADMPGAASLKVVCPACGQWLRLPENEAIPDPAAPPEMLREMVSQSRLVEGDDEASAVPVRESPAKLSKPWWKFW